MSGLRVNTLRGASTGTSPTFPDGVIVSGVTTSTSFSGNLTGNVTGNVTGNITGTTGTFTGNVSVGGTLTYEDVTNVDSVGVITARNGIRIGAGQSVSAVSGIVTYYGDGSKLTGVESGVSNFVASGTIPNGSTVVIKTDGTAAVVGQSGSANPSVGTPVVFNSGNTTVTAAAFDSSNNKVVVAYQDVGNSEYGTAIVGTVSGTSISFGSEVVFKGQNASDITCTYVTSGKVVIAYRTPDTSGQANYGRATVGTVSGTSISFGSQATFNSAVTAYISSTYDSSSGKVVIAYRNDGDGSKATAIVGTVSGTSISFGSAVEVNNSNSPNVHSLFDSTNNKVVIVYEDAGNSDYGTARVGTVSGTSISFGSEVVFESATSQYMSSAFDSTNGKVVIVYNDGGNSNYGTAIVGTVSGTSISFGSAVVFNSGSTTYRSSVYDSTKNKVIITYRDGANSNYGTVIVGTVSGTSISFGTPAVFESSTTQWMSSAFDSTNGKTVVVYQDGGNSNYGTTAVLQADSVSTNLTAENYIGIAAEAIANGATGKVNILGGVNSGQTGLTTAKTYYVQNNGSLATSAGDPSVVAGTSISSTKILIR